MIRVITTGGTIAERPGRHGRLHLGGDQLVGGLAGPSAASVEVVDLLDLPSTFITTEDMFRIAHAVNKARAESRIRGVVITHGTATMEETAFFVDQIIAPGKPVVFTGAMLPPGTPGYDGAANLAEAIALANSDLAYGRGVLIAMHTRVHAAGEVVKAHSTALDAFRSPGSGPVGRNDGGAISFFRQVVPLQLITGAEPPVPEVALLICYAGMTDSILMALRSLDIKGVVVAGMTSGAVPPWLADPLEQMVSDGIAVAVTTRCTEGTVLTASPDRRPVPGYPEYLFARAIIPTTLPGLKARIRMALLLSARIEGTELRRRMLA